MAIDFRCQGCNRLLRTEDTDAGKPARCPECGQVTTVPTVPIVAESLHAAGAGQAADRTDAPQPAPGAAAGNPDGNPYHPPAAPTGRPGEARGAPSPRPALEVGDVLSAAWRLYMDNIGICLGVSVALVALTLVVLAVVLLLMVGATVMFVETMDEAGAVLAFVLMIPLVLALVAFGAWLRAGLITVLLKIARGEDDVVFGDLFSGGRYVLPLLGSSLMVGAMVFAGMLACIVPGIILELMFIFYAYVVVDREQGALQSLGTARRLTDGNLLNVFLLWMLQIGITMVAGMIPCGIGQVLAMPLLVLMWVVAYLRLSGQPVAEKRPQPAPMPMAPQPPGAPQTPMAPQTVQPRPPTAPQPEPGDSPFGS